MQTFELLREIADQPEEREASIAYLAEHMRFLKRRERVLICFEAYGEGTLAELMIQAVLRIGAEPIVWRDDFRWKTLLRLAFSTRASTVIGAPMIILGLAKLARVQKTPLYIRNAVTAGYPCHAWMIDGIKRGLDCEVHTCFDVHESNMIVGFSCDKCQGVHLREDVYNVDIMDADGNLLPDEQTGDAVLSRRDRPQLRLKLKERGSLSSKPCPCGENTKMLMDFWQKNTSDSDLADLVQDLYRWSSILDCSVRRGEYGLEMEIVVFPGEKLPVLPNAAKRIVRPWDSETDCPIR